MGGTKIYFLFYVLWPWGYFNSTDRSFPFTGFHTPGLQGQSGAADNVVHKQHQNTI